MEAILFYSGLAIILFFCLLKLVTKMIEEATRRKYLKRMDAKTRATMASKDY